MKYIALVNHFFLFFFLLVLVKHYYTMHNFTFFCLKKKPNQCIVDIYAFFMHLADAFIQSDLLLTAFRLYIIIFFLSVCVPWELNPWPFALLTQCSTTEPQEHPTFEAQCYIKAIKFQEECFQPFFKYIFYIKIWHAASNNGINLFKIIVINNHNYNLKGIIDNYDFCHNRAALTCIDLLQVMLFVQQAVCLKYSQQLICVCVGSSKLLYLLSSSSNNLQQQ